MYLNQKTRTCSEHWLQLAFSFCWRTQKKVLDHSKAPLPAWLELSRQNFILLLHALLKFMFWHEHYIDLSLAELLILVLKSMIKSMIWWGHLLWYIVSVFVWRKAFSVCSLKGEKEVLSKVEEGCQIPTVSVTLKTKHWKEQKHWSIHKQKEKSRHLKGGLFCVQNSSGEKLRAPMLFFSSLLVHPAPIKQAEKKENLCGQRSNSCRIRLPKTRRQIKTLSY